jgi:hypothetical protein
MNGHTVATGSALGGAAWLAACSCGVATGTVGLLALGGVTATNPVVHPVLVGVGAALLLGGLWHVSRTAAAWAAAGLMLIAGGAVLAPPSSMTLANIPHSGLQFGGLWLYLGGAALIVVGFLEAYPPPTRNATVAASGMAVAAGCNCCMVTGALAGILGTVGFGMPWIYSEPVIFWTAMGLVTYGLFRVGGWRPAALVPVGALVIWGGPQVLRALWPDMMLQDVNLRFIPAFLVVLAGLGLILYGFVLAYRLAGGIGGRAEDVPPEERSDSGVMEART